MIADVLDLPLSLKTGRLAFAPEIAALPEELVNQAFPGKNIVIGEILNLNPTNGYASYQITGHDVSARRYVAKRLDASLGDIQR